MPPFKPNKMRLCQCGCGEPVHHFVNKETGRFKGYAKYAKTCKTRLDRLHTLYPSRGRKGSANHTWKPIGTKALTSHGYVKIKVAEPNIWAYEHRYVVEQLIGRPLKTHEHVHHKDHDMQNNNIENLILLSNSHHQKHHAKKRKESGKWSIVYKACQGCGTIARPHCARGLCNPCYQQWYKYQNPLRFKRYYKQQYQRRKHKMAL